ncbi:hypothetical protein [Nocardia sp. XZ_19_369]|uniref:hypothetical protein n=1 Tax=Nocardia sp. XZ_19_369 TaxID=2769487 RepID=UPI00188F471B|nr:hypothetical protein [Nocardia sp. XZ_19_369]
MLETEDGRKIRTVEVDPKQGPLLQTAFELYATGDYSTIDIEQITEGRALPHPPITPKAPTDKKHAGP